MSESAFLAGHSLPPHRAPSFAGTGNPTPSQPQLDICSAAMSSDDVVWSLINHGFCSFKSKTVTQTFCRSPYNVSGLCLRSACPLANSRYSTIVEKNGVCYLLIKVPERAHLPSKLWDRIKLPANYAKALQLVSEKLEYFPKYLRHRTKQRLTKMHQYLIRMRKLQLKTQPQLTRVNKKEERQERRREERAEKIAEVDRAIEKELLERLRSGTYGDIYNFPSKQFTKLLDENEQEQESEAEAGGGAADEFVDVDDLSDSEAEALFDEFEEEEEEEEEGDMEDFHGADRAETGKEDASSSASEDGALSNDAGSDDDGEDSEEERSAPPRKRQATAAGASRVTRGPARMSQNRRDAPRATAFAPSKRAVAPRDRRQARRKRGVEIEYEMENERQLH